MSHKIKLAANYTVLTNLSVGLFASLVSLLMITPVLLPVNADALSLNNVTDGVTKVLTMGKSTTPPVYTPAPSNAPAGATDTDTPAANSPVNTATSANASKTTTASNATANSAATSPATSGASQNTNQPNLYAINELSAKQQALVRHTVRFSLLTGAALIIVAAVIFGLQQLARNDKLDEAKL